MSSPPPPPEASTAPPPAENTTPLVPAAEGNTTTPPSAANSTNPPPPPVVSTLFPPPPTAIPPPPSRNTALVALGVGVGLGGLITLIAVGIFVIWYRRRKRKRLYATSDGAKDEHFDGSQQLWQQSAPLTDHMIAILPKPAAPPGAFANSQVSSFMTTSSENSSTQLYPGTSHGSSKTTFTYEELSQATDNFSHANLLGQGGFGFVHKGILTNGKEVAVKQLKIGSGQGEREFQAEIDIIGRIHHRHLVSLVGYCISGAQRLLVYEFVPNKTLEFHLHEMGRSPLSWGTRMKIALGSAKGLMYLHEDCHPKVIHRDIKAANVLLDYNFEPKVADFGLARLNLDTDTHVSTRVMGTFGYLAPEYALTGKLTDKSDVFSFGVMLLELITGRRPIGNIQFVDDNIVDWARPLLRRALEDGNFDTLVDSRLQKDYDCNEMKHMVACAAVCVRHLARRRPRMSLVVRALEGHISLDELNEGIRPGDSTVYGSYGSSDFDNSQYKEELKKFKKLALESEYSGPTSEYDIQQNGSSSEVLETTREIDISSGSEVREINISSGSEVREINISSGSEDCRIAGDRNGGNQEKREQNS